MHVFYAYACICLPMYVLVYICGFYMYVYIGIMFKNEHV